MDVDDKELLALAGGDSSDEETEVAPTTASKAASPLSPATSSQNHVKDASAGLNNSTPAASSGKPRGRSESVKKAHRDDTEEEGETSSTPGSPSSLKSAPMSESESDSPPVGDNGVDGPVFTIDNKFYDEKDKKKIMALPELQREAVLAERAQQDERKRQDQQLRRLLQARGKSDAASMDKKRKAPDLEESPRKSSRQKTTLGGRKVGETSGAIEAYKRQREEKGLRDQQARITRENRRKDRHARSSSGNRYSSADADGESEVEWDDAKPKVNDYSNRSAQPIEYDDFRRATLPRRAFAEFCFYPGFADTIKDCYVRIPAKPKPNGEAAYELALIKGLLEKDDWNYAVEKPNGKKFVTNQHALVTIDGAVKDFHFNSFSNSRVSEVEVANYKNRMAGEGKVLPTKLAIEAKLREIDALVNHRFTDEELQEKLRRSGALNSRTAPLQRADIANRLRLAEEREDEAEIARCNAELAALNGPKLRYGTTLVDTKVTTTPPTGPTQQERLHEINLKNRKQNREDVRKAQLAERKAERLAREAVNRGEALQNPFARVKTHAKTHYDVNETLAPHRARQAGSSRDISRAGTPSSATVGTPQKEIEKPAFPSPPQKHAPSGMPVLGNRNMDDDIIAAMDLGIDVEI